LSWHHSQALPCISKSPQSFALSLATGCVLPPEFTRYQAYLASSASSLPKQYLVSPLPARQLYSHSASVGKRYFVLSFSLNQVQKSTAFCQVTNTTGWSSP